MANITVQFSDGTGHVYQNVPDNVTPDQVASKAMGDFGGKSIAHIAKDQTTAPPTQSQPKSMAQNILDSFKQSGNANYKDMSAGDVATNAAKNIIPSTGKVISGLGHVIANPVDTAVGAANLGAGEVLNILPESMQPSANKFQIDQAKTVNDFYKNRYGSEEGFKKAVSEDPASVLLDFSTLMSGGAGLASKVGMVDTAANLSKAADLTNPLNAVGKAAKIVTVPVRGTANLIANKVTDMLPSKAGDQAREANVGDFLRNNLDTQNYITPKQDGYSPTIGESYQGPGAATLQNQYPELVSVQNAGNNALAIKNIEGTYGGKNALASAMETTKKNDAENYGAVDNAMMINKGTFPVDTPSGKAGLRNVELINQEKGINGSSIQPEAKVIWPSMIKKGSQEEALSSGDITPSEYLDNAKSLNATIDWGKTPQREAQAFLQGQKEFVSKAYKEGDTSLATAANANYNKTLDTVKEQAPELWTAMQQHAQDKAAENRIIVLSKFKDLLQPASSEGQSIIPKVNIESFSKALRDPSSILKSAGIGSLDDVLTKDDISTLQNVQQDLGNRVVSGQLSGSSKIASNLSKLIGKDVIDSKGVPLSKLGMAAKAANIVGNLSGKNEKTAAILQKAITDPEYAKSLMDIPQRNAFIKPTNALGSNTTKYAVQLNNAMSQQ